jgi:hypothetical protein
MLTSAASAGDTTIYTAAAPIVNDMLVLGSLPVHAVRVTGVTGSGPYTVTIAPGVATAYTTGTSVTALPTIDVYLNGAQNPTPASALTWGIRYYYGVNAPALGDVIPLFRGIGGLQSDRFGLGPLGSATVSSVDLPVADPSGTYHVDSTNYPNNITGTGNLDVAVFPVNTGALAIAIEGDAYPRWVLSSDPVNGGFYFGDGTFDPTNTGNAAISWGSPGVYILSNVGMIIQTGGAVPIELVAGGNILLFSGATNLNFSLGGNTFQIFGNAGNPNGSVSAVEAGDLCDDGSTPALWIATASGNSSWVPFLVNPMTTKGDLIYENATPAATRLPIGSSGQVLSVVSGLPAWATLPAVSFNAATTNSFVFYSDSYVACSHGTSHNLAVIKASPPSWLNTSGAILDPGLYEFCTFIQLVTTPTSSGLYLNWAGPSALTEDFVAVGGLVAYPGSGVWRDDVFGLTAGDVPYTPQAGLSVPADSTLVVQALTALYRISD